MLRYLGGRFFSGLLTLFLFVTLLFFIVSVVLPGDWTSQFILTAEGKMTLQEALGLDRPLGEQYVDWISGILVLDLGTSFTGPPVWDMILWALPSTLFVLVVGVGLAFLLGSYLGRASAYGDRPLASGGLTFVSVLCLTVFPPAIAVAILQGGEAWLGFVEFAELRNIEHPLFLDGTYDPRDVLWQMLGVLVASLLIVFAVKWFIARYLRRRVPGWLSLLLVVAIPLGVWRLVGISGPAWDIALSMSVLILGVVVLTFGEVVLVTRAAMEDSLLEDYVMVARARGLPEARVRDKHAARTALLPVLSRFVVAIPYFLTGLVILESVFLGRGMGSLVFNAVTDQDIPLVVGSMLVVGVLTLLLRIALDLAHALLDPRIRFGVANGK